MGKGKVTTREGTTMAKPDVRKIAYYNADGRLLWQEPMIFRCLWAIEQTFVRNSITFLVLNCTVEGDVQKVVVKRLGDAPGRIRSPTP
jgi:hypothetical protein